MEKKMMELKLTGISLKRPQNGTDTQHTQQSKEVFRIRQLIPFPYFELLPCVDRYISIQILIFTLIRNVI